MSSNPSSARLTYRERGTSSQSMEDLGGRHPSSETGSLAAPTPSSEPNAASQV